MAGFLGFILVLWVVLGIAVGIDASINSSQSGFLWGLAVFIGGIFGVLIYVLVGRDKPGRETSTRRTNQPRSAGTAGQGDVSHVCKSCGETYRTTPSTEIDTCRSCGGIHVERV
ncbi:UspA domain-containing protein [Halorhabdus tiamatea SARL4B]|uniref:UspA domain-containing protein n=1 Tax=Halorhabdus tiamatea SARL4B TaxID=1033806 RepID=U2F7Q4_9EURY|nr:hypothetical protein [Halorhabdus tiamatea]ERJ04584.1 UspA domain-containing protein [Halorhabdus tiamatea SARL4B]